MAFLSAFSLASCNVSLEIAGSNNRLYASFIAMVICPEHSLLDLMMAFSIKSIAYISLSLLAISYLFDFIEYLRRLAAPYQGDQSEPRSEILVWRTSLPLTQ